MIYQTLPLYHFQFVPDRSYLRIGALWRACDSADHHLPHDWDAEHFFHERYLWHPNVRGYENGTKCSIFYSIFVPVVLHMVVRSAWESFGTCINDYLTLYEPLPLSVPPLRPLVYLYWGLFGNYHLRYVRSEAQGRRQNSDVPRWLCQRSRHCFPNFPEY